MSVSLSSSKVVTAPPSPPIRPERSSPITVFDGARDAAMLGARNHRWELQKLTLALPFAEEAQEENDLHGMRSSALHRLETGEQT